MNLKSSKKDIKTNRGITLIALVITIIVLLILAGVAIATLTGDNGILTKAGDARNTTQEAEIEEEIRVAWNKVYMDSYLDSNTNKATALQAELKGSVVTPNGDFLDITYKGKTLSINATTGAIKQPLPVITAGKKAPATSNAQYKSGNYTAIIPAGFTVSNQSGESSIETGLVIRDDDGNEFVWIPVGIPWKTDSTKTITLSRYKFDDNGVQDDKGANTIDDYYTELASSSYGNAVAKTNAAGGFWIGRYEARIEGYTSVNTNCPYNDPNWVGYTGGKLVEKPGAQVFNYITQKKASELSRTMYSANNYFESDLVNSYAWDTATLFLQEYDNRTYNINTNSNYKAKYSRQIRLSEGLKNTGTNASSITDANKDKICNVYDMADNCFEWTTETSSSSNSPCVRRGGYCYDSVFYTSYRRYDGTTSACSDFSFRPLLYVMQN